MLMRLELMTIAPKVILDIGCGTGESSAQLALRYPDATIFALDIAMAMAISAKTQTPILSVLCAQAEKLPIRAQSVDLVFANFLMPWQTEVKAIMSEFSRVLRPEGLLMLSALGVDTLQEWREVLQTEHIPSLVDMHDVGDALTQAGFADPVLDVNYYHVSYKDKMRLLLDLCHAEMWYPPLETDLSQIVPPVSQDGKWLLTYEVIYAHAFGRTKKGFSASEDGVIKIPLAHLRRR